MVVLKKSNVPNPKEEVASMFKKARKRVTDELGFDEFASLMIYGTIIFPSGERQKGLSAEKIDELQVTFGHFDKDGSGKISLQEFKNLVKAVGKQLPVTSRPSSNPAQHFSLTPSRFFLTTGKGVTDAELQELLKEADTNGDGEIGFAEFVALMGFKEEISVYRNAFRVSALLLAACLSQTRLFSVETEKNPCALCLFCFVLW